MFIGVVYFFSISKLIRKNNYASKYNIGNQPKMYNEELFQYVTQLTRVRAFAGRSQFKTLNTLPETNTVLFNFCQIATDHNVECDNMP